MRRSGIRGVPDRVSVRGVSDGPEHADERASRAATCSPHAAHEDNRALRVAARLLHSTPTSRKDAGSVPKIITLPYNNKLKGFVENNMLLVNNYKYILKTNKRTGLANKKTQMPFTLL